MRWFLLVTGLYCGLSLAEVRVPLYEVELPVAEQSNAERQRASREALLVVLSRVTGLASVPRTPEIRAALERPDRLYSQFVFAGKDDELVLRLTFAEREILALVNDASLPVWWSRRPQVVAWVVVDGNDRNVLTGNSSHPLARELDARSSARGLPTVLPIMDLDDSLVVSPDDVWDRAGDLLDQASRRYNGDLILTGRVSERFSLEHGVALHGEWEVWVDGEVYEASFDGVSAEAAAAIGIDLVVDQLFAKYAVLSRSLQRFRIGVSGVESSRSYAALIDYLRGLEFVDSVGVARIEPRAITLEVVTRASAEQLMMLLTHEGELVEDAFHRGLDPRMIWRGAGD